MRISLAASLALGLAWTGAAAAQGALSTISDYEDAIKASASRLDGQVNERQKAGDMAAAQRLVLAAAMARRAAEEFRGAEQQSLTDPLSGLPAPVPARVAEALAISKKAEAAAAGDPGFPEEALGVYNALLAALPTVAPHPVLYGLLSRDIADAPLPSDIVIYGYRINDPEQRANPLVTFNRQELPATVAQNVKIDVSLPDDVKKALNFAPDPCQSRGGFAVRVRNTYLEKKGVWPVVWRNQVTSNTDLYVLPSPLLYAAKITTTTQAVIDSVTTVPFSKKSELASADCGQTRRVSLDVPLPSRAREVVCTGEWVDASGDVKRASRCEVAAGVAHVSGELTGGVRVCSPDKLCTCPNSAQGFLEARGSYQMRETERKVTEAAQAAPAVFPAGGLAEVTLAPAAGQKLRHIGLSFSRRSCATEVDALDLNIGDDPEGKASGASKTGAFRASVTGDTLKLGAADALAPDIGKVP